MPWLRVLTDRGTEYCGKGEQHDHQLYLAVSDIDRTRTRAQSPQTNGICERFHKTILNASYQEDLDAWIDSHNHTSRNVRRTPMRRSRRQANLSRERRSRYMI